MKLDRKSTLKLISATAVTIFSLVVSFSGAIAWFSAVRNVDNGGNDFVVTGNASITGVYIVPFLGETYNEVEACYTFDYNNIETAYEEGVINNSADTVKLNEYSLENPNHPILMLFAVEGVSATIKFKTEYCFLGNDRNEFIADKTQTKALLNSLEKTKGKYYEVLEDESLSAPYTGEASLYYYNGSTLESRTYTSKSVLDGVAEGFSAAEDNNYYRVIQDNDHGNVSAIYQYNDSTEELDMVWIDLGNQDYGEQNPLSSVVKFHYFTFSGALEDLPTSHTVDVETFTDDYHYTVMADQNCIAIPKSGLTDSNKKSFTNFTSNEDYTYRKSVIAFNGDVTNKTFVGIVVNYEQLALEYVFSSNLGHEALNAGLSFVCDWTTEF